MKASIIPSNESVRVDPGGRGGEGLQAAINGAPAAMTVNR
jgi:hypothetical protein